jgi:1,4-alpha-glucan branching enzyme
MPFAISKGEIRKMPRVQLTYHTGISRVIFSSAVVVGSWNADRLYSDAFFEIPMDATTAPDGCPLFIALVDFPDSEIGRVFRWGVRGEQEGRSVWAIVEEVNDLNSRELVRSFELQGGAAVQVEWYRLNWSRLLGAQKVYGNGWDGPRIQFSVWAPQARNVEVLMGDLRGRDGGSHIDPNRSPALGPTPTSEIFGGYIGDHGEGTLSSWGPFSMARDGLGIWQTSLDDPALEDFDKFNHVPYMFRVTQDDGSVKYRTDLSSRCQIGFGGNRPSGEYHGPTANLDGSVSCSVVKDPDMVCRHFEEGVYPEQNWLTAEDFWAADSSLPTRSIPNRVEDLVIYELHIGALGFGKADSEPGTLMDALRFLDHLQLLGVNAVELLPMAEFGGGGQNWGYATSHYFAIEYAGGGRDKYKHFIRECHRRGIAVILDVVFNHYNHNAERAEWMYDSNAHQRNIYYWYEGHPDDYSDFNSQVAQERRGQGGYVDNLSTGWAPRYWEPMVRRMFVSSLITLVSEFKIDGFRFDQTTSIHAYNALHANGAPVGAANSFGQKLLREATRTLRMIKPDIILMAEDHSNWQAVTESPDVGGLGFDATWYADFYHHLIGDTDKGSDYAKLLKTAGFGGNEALAIDYFAGALASTGARRIVYQESHDEAGNGIFTDRTINVAVNGAPLFGDTRRVAEARVRLVTGITVLSAGTPMFLFGEEVGAERKFLYGEVLKNREDVEGLRSTHGRNLFEFYKALIALRLAPGNSALRSRDIEIVAVQNANRILAFRRWHRDQNFLVVCSFANSPYNTPGYLIESSRLGDETWREVFNSDSVLFGGSNIGNAGTAINSGPGRLHCVVPACGFTVFERV